MTEKDRTLRVTCASGRPARRAVGEFLKTHPEVASFTTAPSDKGGGGVTLVELKE